MHSIEDFIKAAESSYKLGESKRFMEISNNIRSLVSPKTSFPGKLAKCNEKLLIRIRNVLYNFAQMIFSDRTSNNPKILSYGIDSFCTSGICLLCSFLLTMDKETIKECYNDITDAVEYSRHSTKKDTLYALTTAYNCGALLFKNKGYHECRNFLRITISTVELEDKELVGSSYKILAQTCIALNQYDENFARSLSLCSDRMSVLKSWVSANPPNNPEKIAEYINDKKTAFQLSPYFALHGYFDVIPEDSPFVDLYFKLRLPKFRVFEDDESSRAFLYVQELFYSNSFNESFDKGLILLQELNKIKAKPSHQAAILLLHYFIVRSAINLGRPKAALYYAKRIQKIFYVYPFTVGFGVFLELLAKIHRGSFNKLPQVPKLLFDSEYDWNATEDFYKAMMYGSEGHECCFNYFEKVLNQPNKLISDEAFNYYIVAQRLFGITPELSYIPTTAANKALYVYHEVIEQLKYEPPNDSWDFKNPIPPNPVIVDNLRMALKQCVGYSYIERKIKQLLALVIGNSDPKQTSLLLASSVSTQLDSVLKHFDNNKFELRFPILVITYFDVQGLDKCLLFAIFHSQSPACVARLDTGDFIDDFLDNLQVILSKSNNVPSTISRNEWWATKRQLDSDLSKLLEQLEANLDVFNGLLFPSKLSSKQTPLSSAAQAWIRHTNRVKDIDKYSELFGVDVDISKHIKGLPLGLILGKKVHKIPWESLPIVKKNKVPIFRIPSMKIVALKDSIPVSIDPNSSYFVLNPKGDLDATETTFSGFFKHLGWKGVVRHRPDAEVIEKEIKKRDLYVYCGHGSGDEFFDYNQLIEKKDNCKASMILMGCSSGALDDKGETDPNGVPYSCVAAGSGAVVANLWNVTDRDIDRFLEELLKETIDTDDSKSLEQAVNDARSACKLKYLTGAAPVIYGFPAVFRSEKFSSGF